MTLCPLSECVISLWIELYILRSAETWPPVAFDVWLKWQWCGPPRFLLCKSPYSKYQEMAVFHRICGSKRGGGGLAGAIAAPLVYSFFCVNWKKKEKILWGLVKEYLRRILSSRCLLHLYMSLFNIYISLLDWIPLLALCSCVCLKDKKSEL